MRLEGKALRVVRGDRVVLRDVDIAIDGGEVLGVLGPSGAGKSTLFRALVGELTPDSGQVLLSGSDVTRAPLWERARAGVGYVPQTPSVLWDLTVRDNLSTFLRLGRGHASERAGRAPASRTNSQRDAWTVASLATKVDLEPRFDVVAGRLSGGERRRLELARALCMDPTVLVCDEPFAGVDPQGAERLGELLRGLAESGVAVVLADHHVEEALRICTRALLLLDGAVAAEGDPSTFVEHPLVKGRYLGTVT